MRILTQIHLRLVYELAKIVPKKKKNAASFANICLNGLLYQIWISYKQICKKCEAL